MAIELNQFFGMWTEQLEAELADKLATVERMSNSDEGLGGGSPFESIMERIDDLEAELKRRGVAIKPQSSEGA